MSNQNSLVSVRNLSFSRGNNKIFDDVSLDFQRGKITAIDSRIDPATRSIAVRADLPNTDGALRPGLFMTVTVRGKQRPTLLLPEEALVPEQGRNYVFVVVDGKAVRKELKLGGREPGRVAIVAGLADTDDVIVEGTQRVRSGGKVIAKPRS